MTVFYTIRHGTVKRLPESQHPEGEPHMPPTVPTQLPTSAAPANDRTGRGKKGQGKYLKTTPKLADRFRIARWLEERRNELLAERPHYADVAERCGKDLVLTVSEDTMRNTAKACGTYWYEMPKRSENKSRNAPHHNNTRNTVTALRRQAEALRTALVSLYSRMGERPPPEVTSLWPEPAQDSVTPTTPST